MATNDFSKKQHARVLYLYTSLTYKEIAHEIGVSRQTIATWVKANGWDTLKNFDLENVEVARKWLTKLDTLADKPETEIKTGDANNAVRYSLIVSRLSSSSNLNDDVILKSLKKFNEWVEIHRGVETAQQIGELMNDFVLYNLSN